MVLMVIGVLPGHKGRIGHHDHTHFIGQTPGLRPLRFHDLRHTFGTRVIGYADIRRVQEWMGHADVQTTMRYLHYAPRHDDAATVARAFATAAAPADHDAPHTQPGTYRS
jgi:integrase